MARLVISTMVALMGATTRLVAFDRSPGEGTTYRGVKVVVGSCSGNMMENVGDSNRRVHEQEILIVFRNSEIQLVYLKPFIKVFSQPNTSEKMDGVVLLHLTPALNTQNTALSPQPVLFGWVQNHVIRLLEYAQIALNDMFT
jgi:hypothetical protein